MTFKIFLSFISVLSGLMASLYFCVGALKMSTKDIAEESKTGYGGYTSRISDKLIKQKSEFLCGGICLLITFVTQFVILFDLALLKNQITRNFGCGFWLAFFVIILVSVALFFFRRQYLRIQRQRLQLHIQMQKSGT